ncbi:MAG: WbqC family protein [Gammaproteobacteria bacterium]|nr:WbqC family protein [Gammaproteobacteria bacterium]
MKRAAISQSNYIPWKGYFDLIASVDVFVLYDDMQYTRRDWRNRNKIKTAKGLRWLTIPVQSKGKYLQKVNETLVDGNDWTRSHWNQLRENYKIAPHFEEIETWLKPLYLTEEHAYLSGWNRLFIEKICQYLKIETEIKDSRELLLQGGKSERLAHLCEQLNATEYVTGPAAKVYIEEKSFADKGVEVSWFDYSAYPVYPQLNGEFEHAVSVVDLLFNLGPQARDFMKY